MAMRSECKHFESRSYANGDTVRKCKLDLAPEAPWHCPAECPKYERRLADAGWVYGSLAESLGGTPSEPEVPSGTDVAALLDSAEDIVNAAGAEILAEMKAREEKLAKKRGKRKKR